MSRPTKPPKIFKKAWRHRTQPSGIDLPEKQRRKRLRTLDLWPIAPCNRLTWPCVHDRDLPEKHRSNPKTDFNLCPIAPCNRKIGWGVTEPPGESL